MYLLNELKNNALYKYDNGAYTDFLGRSYRILEDVYIEMLNKQGLIKRKNNRFCIEDVKLSEEQKKILDKKKIQYKDIPVNTEMMNKILSIVIPNDTVEKDLIDECERLKQLRDLRNNSILAHGYDGISDKDINQKIGCKKIKNLLDSIVKKYGKVFNKNLLHDSFYDVNSDLNKHLIQLIEEL